MTIIQIFCIKRDDNECDECIHGKNKLRRKVHKQNYKREQLDINCYDAIGVFKNGVLIIIDNDK